MGTADGRGTARSRRPLALVRRRFHDRSSAGLVLLSLVLGMAGRAGFARALEPLFDTWPVPPGVYFARLEAGARTAGIKITVVR